MPKIESMKLVPTGKNMRADLRIYVNGDGVVRLSSEADTNLTDTAESWDNAEVSLRLLYERMRDEAKKNNS